MKFRFKSYQFATKHEILTLTRNEVIKAVLDMPDSALRSGLLGIWINPKVDIDGTVRYWVHLDFEFPGHAGSLQKTIESAQDFYIQLYESGLAEGLRIVCSGTGIRFLWPWLVPGEYSEAFMLWMRSTKNIDVSPFTNDATCYRLLANRAHSRQGKTKPCHVEAMPIDQNFMDFDEHEYRRLTAGPPNPEHYKRIFPELLPTGYMPQAWVDFLEPWKRMAQLKSAIFTPRFPMPTGAVNWDLIFKALSDQGITYRELSAVGGVSVFKLSKCPSCGRRDGNPYLSNGRLKCHHDNTCDAAKGKGGLGPWQWVEGYERIIEGDDRDATHSLDSAREAIYTAVRGEGNVIIKTTAGGGKTHTTLQATVENIQEKPQLVLFSVPNHKNTDEILGKDLDVAVVKIEGRMESNCHQAAKCRQIGASGLSPKLLVCSKCSKNGRKEEECQYLRQFKNIPESGIVVTTHAQAVLGLVDGLKPDAWIIDENPLSELSVTKSVGLDTMLALKSFLPGECQQIIMKMIGTALEQHGLIDKRWDHGRLYASDTPGGIWKECKALWEIAGITESERQTLADGLMFLHQTEGESLFEWQHRLRKWDIEWAAVEWFRVSLGMSRGAAYIKTQRNRKEPVSFCYHKAMVPDFKGRIVHLDATAHHQEMESLFEKPFISIDATVHLPNCKTVFIRKSFGKTTAEKATPERIRDEVKRCLDHLGPDDNRVLLITHQAAEAQALSAARDLDAQRAFESAHFYATRGLNRFEGFDAVIQLGTPTLNPASLVDDGMVLFPDRQDRTAWERHRNETESYQCLHRVRPVNGGKTIIVLGREWPQYFECKPEITLCNERGRDSRKTTDAIERLKWCLDTMGCVSPDLGLVLGIGNRRKLEYANDTIKLVDNPIVMYLRENERQFYKEYTLEKRCSLDSGLVSKRLSGYMTNQLIYGKMDYWFLLVKDFLAKHPDTPVCETLTGQNWQPVLGTIESVRRMFQGLGLSFNEAAWRERKGGNDETGRTDPGEVQVHDGADSGNHDSREGNEEGHQIRRLVLSQGLRHQETHKVQSVPQSLREACTRQLKVRGAG